MCKWHVHLELPLGGGLAAGCAWPLARCGALHDGPVAGLQRHQRLVTAQRTRVGVIFQTLKTICC